MTEQTAAWQALQDLHDKGKLLNYPRGLHDLQMMVRTIHGIGEKLFSTSGGVFDRRNLPTVTWYCQCLQQGAARWVRPCNELKENARRLQKALPAFEEGKGESRVRATKELWAMELRKLHDICGDWTAMWEEMAVLFDVAVYHDFLTLRHRNPEHPMCVMGERLHDIFMKIESLIDIFDIFEKTVAELDEIYFAGVRMHARLILDNDLAKKRLDVHKAEVRKMEEARAREKADGSSKKESFCTPPDSFTTVLEDSRDLRRQPSDAKNQSPTTPNPETPSYVLEDSRHLRRLPSIEENPAAEDSSSSLNSPRNHHRRSATAPLYPIVALSSQTRRLDQHEPPSTTQTLHPPRAGFSANRARSRPHAPHVPRIFTGSFTQLEGQVSRSGLEGFQTPEGGSAPASAVDAVRVRDFADAATTTSALPSPATLLQRREALVARDAEFETREIRGESVRSRRPSAAGNGARGRSATVEERSGGLEAWLAASSSSPSPSPSAPAKDDGNAHAGNATPIVRRGYARARERTL